MKTKLLTAALCSLSAIFFACQKAYTPSTVKSDDKSGKIIQQASDYQIAFGNVFSDIDTTLNKKPKVYEFYLSLYYTTKLDPAPPIPTDQILLYVKSSNPDLVNVVEVKSQGKLFGAYAYKVTLLATPCDINNIPKPSGSTTINLDANAAGGKYYGGAVFNIKIDNKTTAADCQINPEWKIQIGENHQDIGQAITSDKDNNIYLTGSTEGLLFGSPIGMNAFVAKYNENGTTRLWSNTFGSADGNDQALAIANDKDGNVYMAGWTDGNVDTNTNAGGKDVLLAKFDKNGTKIKVVQVGSAEDDIAYGTALDKDNNIFVVGSTYGDFFGSYKGGEDAFIAKFDDSLNLKEKRQEGDAGDESFKAITSDLTGNVYVTGYASSGWFGGGNGKDVFIAKYSANLMMTPTVKKVVSAGDDEANSIAKDIYGNTYIVGSTKGNFGSMNKGFRDLILAKFDPELTLSAKTQFGSPSDEVANSVSIAFDTGIFIVGTTKGNLFGNKVGLTDGFVLKLTDYSADFMWSSKLATTRNDELLASSVDKKGNLLVVGKTDGAIDGINKGLNDIFFAKFLP